MPRSLLPDIWPVMLTTLPSSSAHGAATPQQHQVATAAVFTSPLLVYGGHPESLLEHPAAEMIKSIPCVWDETIAMPAGEIGEVAAFARRHGDQWFLAILGGPEGKKLNISLSFLDSGSYRAC